MRKHQAKDSYNSAQELIKNEVVDLSIVIANYNNQEYLKLALDSVLNQKTIYKFEVIIIDDCSTDESRKIIDSYQCNEKIIKVFNNNNVGISSVRNSGINLARGKYISFLDADDCYHPDFIQVMLDNVIGSDILICNYQAVTTEGKEIDVFREKDSSDYTSGILQVENSAVVWNKVFKREVVEDIRFVEGVKNEDILFNICASLKTKKVAFIPNVLINYRQVPTSITKKFDLTIINDMNLVLGKIKELTSPLYKKDFVDCYMYYYLIIGLKRWLKCSRGFKEYCEFVRSINKEDVSLKRVISSGKYSYKQKAVVTILYFSKVLLR
ncbi:TPA: glycosyltransferase family 2 protein [Vibrio parahaemolyticus]|nr:glycosyltransferase family 2 protein [Vibrio parahaemolyticus]HCM0821267.1 glycosyltransferase family 2 protein [Vibrio parahaemolyticus]